MNRQCRQVDNISFEEQAQIRRQHKLARRWMGVQHRQETPVFHTHIYYIILPYTLICSLLFPSIHQHTHPKTYLLTHYLLQPCRVKLESGNGGRSSEFRGSPGTQQRGEDFGEAIGNTLRNRHLSSICGPAFGGRDEDGDREEDRVGGREKRQEIY